MKIDAITVKVFVTFFLLSCFGMLFADAVITGLMYRHQLKTEVRHAEQKMSIWSQSLATAKIPEKNLDKLIMAMGEQPLRSNA